MGRALAILLCALIGGTAAPVLAGPPSGIHGPALHDASVDLETKIADHLWYGQIHGAVFGSDAKLPGNVVALTGGADSALWSGVYLAGEAHRYAVDRAAGRVGDMKAAKRRIDALVGSAHLRINISRNWSKDGSASPEGSDYQPGLVDGEAGMLFRNCFPAGVPAWQQDQNPHRHRQIFGPITWDGEVMPWETGVAPGQPRPYYCEDAASRDSHAGTTFGLLAAFDLVGPDDPAMRDMVRDDLLTLTGNLWRHGWSVVRPYIRVETAGSENFVFPLMVINPSARLNMTQAARHVAAVAGTDVDRAVWEAIWLEELGVIGTHLTEDFVLAIDSPHKTYYGMNLNHLTSFNMIFREPVAATREYFRREFAIIDGTTRDDVNAHFETLTYTLTGEKTRSDAAVQHLKEWLQYRAIADEPVRQNSSDRCGVDLECVPEDQVTFTQNGEKLVQPGTSSKLRSATPLPVGQRTKHHDFLWQRSPFELDNGGPQPNVREPGVDFLTPYWMLRYYTDIAEPPLAPLPTWTGPTAT
jgi:hypothetical protein